MPQPLSKVRAKATVSLHFEHSANKPELTVLVAGIVARWAWIEHDLNILLLHILRAEAKPALAMFSILTNPRLQMRDLGEVVGMLTMLRTYLNPYFPDDAAPQDMRWSTRKDALEWMSGLRPFQEALVRVKARNKNARPDV
jgi:hypothetical protein